MSVNSCTVLINNKRGLHARAAAKFATLANQFPCQVKLGPEQQQLKNGKNILEVMMLAASTGTKLLLQTEGEQADIAMQALVELIENKFHEDE